MQFNVPNTLTSFRVLLIPVMCVLFFLPYEWNYTASGIAFIVASVTDWFDGYLARKLGQTSRFGAFLDPVADKLIVAVALVLIVRDQPESSIAFLPDCIIAISAAIIIGREIVISALREWMAELGQRAAVAVSYIGKVKTAFQMTALSMMLLKHDLFGIIPINQIGLVLLVLASGLTLLSMVLYLRAAWPLLMDEGKKS